MTQTIVDQPTLLTLFADNTTGAISAEDSRDLVVSTVHVLPTGQADENIITPETSGVVPLTIQAASGQTADLLDIKNSSAEVIASINASGQYEGDGSQLTGIVPSTTTITTDAPLAGGGALSGDLTLTISDATTSSVGVVSVPTTGGLSVSTGAVSANVDGTTVVLNGSHQLSVPKATTNSFGIVETPAAGALTNSTGSIGVNVDNSTIIISSNQLVATGSGSVPTSRTVTATSPITGGGALSSNITIGLQASSGSQAGSMSAANYTTLNAATSTDATGTLVMRDSGGGFSAGTIVASLTGHASADLQAVNNLSDVTSVGAARTNLGLGSAATQASSAFDSAGSAASAQAAAEGFAANASNISLGTINTARLPATITTTHLSGNANAPTVATGVALGTGGSLGASMSGANGTGTASDVAGQITLTTGASSYNSGGVAGTITFNKAFAVAPIVMLQGCNGYSLSPVAISQGHLPYAFVSSTSTTGFVITFPQSEDFPYYANSPYIYNYIVMGVDG